MYSRRQILKNMAAGSVLLSFPTIFLDKIYAQSDKFVLVKGGQFQMGSSVNEFLREKDEVLHNVAVSDFFISKYAVTQQDYENVMKTNPSHFKNKNAPVENVTWYDAVEYCNRLSIKDGYKPAYTIQGTTIKWDKSANGYRLPTEAEWEYAARAGTSTPFYTGVSVNTNQANWYGTYPYQYNEKSYRYRQETVDVDSFLPNGFGLYNMSGNVWEWCWDWYSDYDTNNINNPSGPSKGIYKVHRGGGWNDFARHLRSAYRAASVPYNKLYNIGFRLVRSAIFNKEIVISEQTPASYNKNGRNLIVYFTWSGNTGRLARNIHEIVKGDIIQLEMVKPYSTNYAACLSQSRSDQEKDIHPAIKHIDISSYSNIYLGYPTWWATMPMPVWTFLESNNFAGKRIIPFASHGEGRLAQTISAIAKTVPETSVAEAFSIMYSDLSKKELRQWIENINR